MKQTDSVIDVLVSIKRFPQFLELLLKPERVWIPVTVLLQYMSADLLNDFLTIEALLKYF